MPFVVKSCPVMKRWNCCCCSCDLQSAAVIVGWFYMVSSTIGVLIRVVMLSKLGDVCGTSSDVLGADPSLLCELNYLSIFGCTVSGVTVLLYAVLLFGVHEKKPVYMLPSLGWGLTCTIFYLTLGAVRCIMIVIALEEYGLFHVAIFVLSTSFEVYVWIVGYSYYRQLTDEITSVSV